MRVRFVRQLWLLMVGFCLVGPVWAGGGDPAAPSVSAEKVKYTFTADANPTSVMPVRLLEGVEIWPAAEEGDITHYNVYWGDSERNKLGGTVAQQLAHIPAAGTGEVLVHEFEPALPMEVGAIWLLVCTENAVGEFCGKDNNMQKISDDLIGMSNTLNAVKSQVNANDESSCPGIEVMQTCGDLVCNGIETASSCPSDCSNYGLSSFNYQTLCNDVQNVYHPTSVTDIQSIVSNAAANGQRIKVNGGAGYRGTTGSASDAVCTDGVVISMDLFDESAPGLDIELEVFEGQEVVSAPAGTNMHELGEWLHARGRSVGFTHLGWRHASLAGNIGTSAHGSSPRHSNVLAQRVVALDIVNPDGEVKTYSKGTTGVSDPDLWKAMTTHLGLFGVITRVRLAVEDALNVQVKVTFHEEAELFEENTSGGVYEDIQDCDYGQYNWFPSLNKYMRTCGTITTAAEEEGANNRLIYPFIDTSQMSTEQTLQALQLGGCQPSGDTLEKMEYLRYNGWHITPPLVKTVDGTMRYTSNAIGPVHRMTSSTLIDLGREVFQMDWEVAVPAQHLQAAMEYIRDFTNGLNSKNRNVPVPLIGIFVRFSQSESNALMAYTGAGEDFVDGTTAAHIEMPIFVPINLSESQFDEYMAPYEEAMAKLVQDFGARAHWGKNMHSGDPWIFELQQQLGSYGDRLMRFSQKVGEFDPDGVFANRYAKTIGVSYPNFDYPANW